MQIEKGELTVTVASISTEAMCDIIKDYCNFSQKVKHTFFYDNMTLRVFHFGLKV